MEIEEEKVEISHLIPKEIKWAIVFIKKQGYSNKATAREITEVYKRPMNHQSVKRIWNLYEETQGVENQWNFEGRPKVITEETMERLIESCQEDRQMTVKERVEELQINAGRSTVNKALLDEGYKAYRARKKPTLSPENIQDRLNFAQSHEDWEADDWSNVIFTDECSFRLVNSSGRTFIRRREEEKLQEDAFQVNETRTRTLMVWGQSALMDVAPW